MRRVIFIGAVLGFAACPAKQLVRPPAGKLYFPSGIFHMPGKDGGEGVLYVVSANFDRRYDTGLMTAIDLDRVARADGGMGLPPFGAPVASSGPEMIPNLGLADVDSQTVALANFGGDIGVQSMPNGTIRMFLPSRAEGQKLMAVNADGLMLSCQPFGLIDGGPQPAPDDPRNCGMVGASLVYDQLTPTGIPRADSPMSAAYGNGIVWVTSGRQSDTPRFSMTNFNDFIVRMPASDMFVDDGDFVGLGPGSTHAVVVGQRWTYFSGRFPGNNVVVNLSPPLVRMVDNRFFDGGYPVFFPNLENDVHIGEARGIAISHDETRLFLAGRQLAATGDDMLVIANLSNVTADTPTVQFSAQVPVPTEPEMVQTISRGAGRGDLAVVVSSGAGALVIYDDERKDISVTINDVGLQAGSFAINRNGPDSARIFVSDFTNGLVTVVDVPSLDAPETARVVARLGTSQVCLTRNLDCDAGMLP
jgi:hypothetical protein